MHQGSPDLQNAGFLHLWVAGDEALQWACPHLWNQILKWPFISFVQSLNFVWQCEIANLPITETIISILMLMWENDLSVVLDCKRKCNSSVVRYFQSVGQSFPNWASIYLAPLAIWSNLIHFTKVLIYCYSRRGTGKSMLCLIKQMIRLQCNCLYPYEDWS